MIVKVYFDGTGSIKNKFMGLASIAGPVAAWEIFESGWSTVLKKYQVPATIFVATGAIGTGKLIWHDRVFDAFRFATARRARLAKAPFLKKAPVQRSCPCRF